MWELPLTTLDVGDGSDKAWDTGVSEADDDESESSSDKSPDIPMNFIRFLV